MKRSRYGFRGIRVGEASHPGPQQKRRRRLASSSDTDAQTMDTDDAQPLIRRLESPSDVEPPSEVIRALEEDLVGHPRAGQAFRRVALVPEDSQGTPRSVQDREPPSSVPISVPRSTIPASTGAVRRLVLIHSQQLDPPTTVAASSGVVRDFQNRFEVLREPDDAVALEGEIQHEEPRSDVVSDTSRVDFEDPATDTASNDGVSEAGEEAREEPTPPEMPIRLWPRGRQEAFASLDGVQFKNVFSRRPRLMRTIPFVLKGAFRCALRTALDEVIAGHEQGNDSRMARGWKLFMLLPRLLLFRPSRGGMVPKKKLEERVSCFNDGSWLRLLEESQTSEAQAHQTSSRRRRNQVDSVEKRASKALSLVQMGELSAARVSLEGAEVAPGNLMTLRELTNPERRPPFPRQELSQEIARSEPERPFDLDVDEFLVCLRTSRRGAAGGPSGMTAEHLFPLLDNERDSAVFGRVATLMVRGEVPTSALEGIRLGRLTALKKPDGGVRGIVVGDIMRRLVARTISKQVAKEAEQATAPFQYALSTKAGCECVAHIIQTMTDQDGEATVVSIDGVGAYDLISRQAMMEGLLGMNSGDQILPFVRMFYGSPSKYVWEDEMGNSQDIPQGEGGEQGDPLMPLLFALGLHRALRAVRERLEQSEMVFAFLDDVYVICSPRRVLQVHQILEEELLNHAQISVHYGKTQVWNRGGVPPPGMDILTRAARRLKPEAVVWRGDTSLPRCQQGVKILGVPVGQPEFVVSFLERKSEEHSVLFQRIPAVEDPQAAWLLLLMCASTRANYWLRSVRPDLTEAFAHRHDVSVWECLCQVLRIPPHHDMVRVTASLPFSVGGLGLPAASRSREGAHWASWADCLPMVHERHPTVATAMVQGLTRDPAPCFDAVRTCVDHLIEAGFGVPSWSALRDNTTVIRADSPEPSEPKFGWQHKATRCVHQTFHDSVYWPELSDPELALMRFQHGPLASAVLTAVPTSRMTRIEAQPFRLLLLRRLRLPLPLTSRTCRCGRLLDSFGHHRAACSGAGVLGERGFPLEQAAAQVCREAGARVRTNTFVRDMDLEGVNILDGRRLEVVADGLSLWHGAQLAIDTTLVSPLRRDGRARRTAADRNGVALKQARRLKETTYPELSGEDGRARLVVLAAEIGGRWSEETAQFLRALAKAHARSVPLLLQSRVKAAWLRRWSNILACAAARAFRVVPPGQAPEPGNRGRGARDARGVEGQ